MNKISDLYPLINFFLNERNNEQKRIISIIKKSGGWVGEIYD